MSGTRYFTANPFEVDINGVPYAGGQLYFYATGTSTFQNTYQDVALTIPNTNPVIADANGRFGNIWLLPSNGYAVILYDQFGNEIWAADPVGPGAGGTPASSAGIIGEVRAFCGTSPPSGWYLPYGQAVSRTIYSAAFAVLGTTYGPGDGSTTFNLPDLRGRAIFGIDNMGGAAANRVTSGVSGISGSTLGGSGGDQHAQGDTLSATSTVTDPGHNHTVTLPTGSGVQSGGTTGQAGASTTNEATSTVTTGITVSTSVSGVLTGASQNMPPTMMLNLIIYLGA